MTDDALFVPDGDAFVATEHTRGPWDPLAQHGGPVAALLARAVESVATPVPMAVVRLSVELFRPVPLQRLFVSAGVIRPGRRVQVVEARLRDDGGVELSRATALLIREGSLTIPDSPPGPLPPPLPTRAQPSNESADAAFHLTGVEMRFAAGSFERPGPSTVWMRLRRPVVAGEEPSPLMRVAAAADFGNGVSAPIDWQRFLFINPDLTIHLHRQPEGEWICLDARTDIDPGGRGLAQSALFDARGAIGRSLQSLLVEARGSILR